MSSASSNNSVIRKRPTPSDLLQYARQNRDEGYFNDFTVIAGSESIPANRMVLASNSKYFEKMFKTNMKERYSNTVEIQGAEGKAVKSIIDYFYTESIEINDTNATNLLAAADYLQIHDVKDFCFDFLQSVISPENSIFVLNAANLYGNEVLADQASQFICSSLEAVSQTNDFKSLPKVELISCLSKLKKKQAKATSIYTALISWIKHDKDARQKEFIELFEKLLDLSNFPAEFIEDELLNENLITDNPYCYREVLTTFAKLLRDKSALLAIPKGKVENSEFAEAKEIQLHEYLNELPDFSMDSSDDEMLRLFEAKETPTTEERLSFPRKREKSLMPPRATSVYATASDFGITQSTKNKVAKKPQPQEKSAQSVWLKMSQSLSKKVS